MGGYLSTRIVLFELRDQFVDRGFVGVVCYSEGGAISPKVASAGCADAGI